MGCGSSKEKQQTARTAGNKYHHHNTNWGHAAEDGIQLYPGITGQ
jgi:hypothetical protein